MSEKQQENKTVEIPFPLRYENTKNNFRNAVLDAVNVDKIPFCLIEEFLTNLLYQVRKNAEAERAEAERVYNAQFAESEENARGD